MTCRWCGCPLYECGPAPHVDCSCDDIKHRECYRCKLRLNADVDQPHRRPGTIPATALVR